MTSLGAINQALPKWVDLPPTGEPGSVPTTPLNRYISAAIGRGEGFALNDQYGGQVFRRRAWEGLVPAGGLQSLLMDRLGFVRDTDEAAPQIKRVRNPNAESVPYLSPGYERLSEATRAWGVPIQLVAQSKDTVGTIDGEICGGLVHARLHPVSIYDIWNYGHDALDTSEDDHMPAVMIYGDNLFGLYERKVVRNDKDNPGWRTDLADVHDKATARLTEAILMLWDVGQVDGDQLDSHISQICEEFETVVPEKLNKYSRPSTGNRAAVYAQDTLKLCQGLRTGLHRLDIEIPGMVSEVLALIEKGAVGRLQLSERAGTAAGQVALGNAAA